MKRLVSWALTALTSTIMYACVHPAPAPPPQPVLYSIGIVVQAPDQSRIPQALVQLHEADGYHNQSTDSTGFILFVIPASLIDSDVIINATGYNQFQAHVDVVNHQNYFYTLTPTPPPLPQPQTLDSLTLESSDPTLVCHATQLVNFPTTPDPRFWRGDAWGVVVPGLPMVNGGSSKHPERVLTWFFDRWTADWQTKILDAYRVRGYTHFALSWPDSRDGNGQSVAQFVATTLQVKAAIPYVPVFLTSKNFDPLNADAQTRMAAVTPVMDALIAANATNIFVVGWELNTFNDPQLLQDFINALHARYPTINLYVHFTTYYTSWQVNGQPRAQFWAINKGILTGLLYQGNQNDTCGQMEAHFNDAMVPASGLQAAGALLVPWELQASNSFDGDHPTEDEANARGWELMATPGPLTVSGFGEGARFPSGASTLSAYPVQ